MYDSLQINSFTDCPRLFDDLTTFNTPLSLFTVSTIHTPLFIISSTLFHRNHLQYASPHTFWRHYFICQLASSFNSPKASTLVDVITPLASQLVKLQFFFLVLFILFLFLFYLFLGFVLSLPVYNFFYFHSLF